MKTTLESQQNGTIKSLQRPEVRPPFDAPHDAEESRNGNRCQTPASSPNEAAELSAESILAPKIRREIVDGVCILTFDRPNSSANIFDLATLAELSGHLDFIGDHPELIGLILFSAKKNIFIAGADLHSIAAETDPGKLRELIGFGQTVFSRIARLPFTTVAAIHGACVGGGFEIALACDWRVASLDRVTRIGLPETQIGLIPAWGGSTRLPRLIGLAKALDVILAGKTLAPKPAFKAGMVDALVPREYLLQAAMKKVRAGEPCRSAHRLQNNPLAAAVLRRYSRRQVQQKTRGHYPAVAKALEVVTRGITRSLGESLEMEVDGIMELAQSPTTRNLIQLFLLQERAKKLSVEQAFQPAGSPDFPVRSSDGRLESRPNQQTRMSALRCAVVGAGVMGSGIAQWLSVKGFPVILRDIKPEFIAKGLSNITKLYGDGVKRHLFTPTEARAGMDRITPAASDVNLRSTDLVIEAAVEEMRLKKEVFRKLEAVSSEHTILATNTSALSIAEIAATMIHPERVIGLHFFNPVHRMQLVEVVRAPDTNPAVLQRAIQFVQQIGKLPLLVNDSPGFLVNRILVPYLVEAGLLFESGASAQDIDEAMLEFGMPMGPLRLLDEVGLDVAHHICVTLSAQYPERLRMPAILDKMLLAGWRGKKSGRGFYNYSKGAKSPETNADAEALCASDGSHSFTRSELAERMVLLMVNEAARCLEEQVVTSPDDVDFGMVMGTGFAPFRGGPLRHADAVGIKNIATAMQRWTDSGDIYFAPCALLQTMASRGETFYGMSGEKNVSKVPTTGSNPGAGRDALPRVRSATFKKIETIENTKTLNGASSPRPSPPLRGREGEGQGVLPPKDDVKSAEPSPKPAEEAPDLIDTSKMSAGQRAALELTEAARDAATGGVASNLFMGKLDLTGIVPFPAQSAEDRDKGNAFVQQLETFLRNRVDPDEIDRTGEIPQDVIDDLGRMGAFGIKISTSYGGLGLSQTNYSRAAMLLGSYCGNLTALLSAHQSIGVPQPLILFGTEEQKQKYLPRFAKGEISAFALTETGVGSDPATMETHAEPTEDGKHFILNGEKLWCTNGTKAGVIVVMAKTPPKVVNGKSKKQVTAFIVEMDWPGVEVVRRCHFMGLKALYNGVIRFNNVRVPRENILLAEGKGLRVALTTLNTGRLTLPAACTGLSKRCLEIVKKWANERAQWGAAIGKHAAIADKVAHMAANIFAMESMTFLTSGLVTRDKHADIRLEAAMCKLWGSETAWNIVNDTMQIRGGRGYETAESLKARGEEGVPVERLMRDCRINTIFEGSSEIMRLFLAREALDPHLKVAAPALDSRLPLAQRARAAARAGRFYARWYLCQWLPIRSADTSRFHPKLARHLRYADRTSRRLARTLFHSMARFGPKLERQQVLLGRLVDIGTELFAITASCSRAQSILDQNGPSAEVLDLVDYFSDSAKLRIAHLFRDLHHNTDRQGYRLAQKVLEGKQESLINGILRG